MEQKLISANEAQKILGLKTVHTVYRWYKKGKLTAVFYGTRNIRFLRKEIENIAKHGFGTKKVLDLRVNKGKPKRSASSVTLERSTPEWVV